MLPVAVDNFVNMTKTLILVANVLNHKNQ